MNRIGRLVAKHFIPNTQNKPQVNHIDGNKQNDCVDNLEWVTNVENILHAFKNGLHTGRGETHCKAKLISSQVIEIRKLSKTHSNKQLAKIYGVTDSNINAIVKRKSWKHLK